MPAEYKSAVHLFFFKKDHILLLRRKNTGYRDGDYSCVAGHLEFGEQVIQSAIREAQEEAGLTLKPNDIEVVGVMHRRSDTERIDFFVHVHQWEGEAFNNEPHKCDHLAWFPLDQLPENTIPYIIRGLDNFKHKRFFDNFGWEQNDL